MPIGSGDLARAVRASMASPGFFAPIRWEGRTLTDGGVNDYLPVDEARAMGADYVIAVDVEKPPARIPSLDALHVADRSLRLTLMRSRVGRSRPDVLILPDLDPLLTGANYTVDPAPIMKSGTATAWNGNIKPTKSDQ